MKCFKGIVLLDVDACTLLCSAEFERTVFPCGVDGSLVRQK